MKTELSEKIAEPIIKKNKKYAVMLFYTEIELGISNTPNKWHCQRIEYFNNGVDALDFYANTTCPASQLIDGENDEELQKEIDQMKKNMNDEDWKEENLYPYL